MPLATHAERASRGGQLLLSGIPTLQHPMPHRPSRRPSFKTPPSLMPSTPPPRYPCLPPAPSPSLRKRPSTNATAPAATLDTNVIMILAISPRLAVRTVLGNLPSPPPGAFAPEAPQGAWLVFRGRRSSRSSVAERASALAWPLPSRSGTTIWLYA